MTEVERELAEPAVWEQPARAQALGREQSELAATTGLIDELEAEQGDVRELFELARDEEDRELLAEAEEELGNLLEKLEKLEFRRMFAGERDPANAYLDIQAGSGGTEAQDWAEMLLRMYLRWCEDKGFATELAEVSDGEVAGIKSATVHVKGEYAFGWLRTETGVHPAGAQIAFRFRQSAPYLLRGGFCFAGNRG